MSSTPNIHTLHRFSYNENSGEVLLIKPDGSAHFLGVWAAIKLMFGLALRRRSFVIDGELIESKTVDR